MKPFSKLTTRAELWKFITNCCHFLQEIEWHRHSNFTAWYSFHPAPTRKIFQHWLIYFIHTSAVKPFSKMTIRAELWKILTNFYHFLWEIKQHRHSNFTAWYLFYPAPTGKIFPHRL